MDVPSLNPFPSGKGLEAHPFREGLGWVSGGIHLEQHAYDRERELFLRGIGLRVLRFVNLEVEHDLEDVLHAIFRHVSSIR